MAGLEPRAMDGCTQLGLARVFGEPEAGASSEEQAHPDQHGDVVVTVIGVQPPGEGGGDKTGYAVADVEAAE